MQLNQITISEHRLNELTKAESDLMKLQRKLNKLDQPTQDLLNRLERCEHALKRIAFEYSCVSPEATLMSAIALDAWKNN